MRTSFVTFIIIILIMSVWQMSAAQETGQTGFLDVPFGSSRDDLVEKIKTRFKMKPSFPLTPYPLNGSGMDFLWTSDSVYCLTNFPLGNRYYSVLFYFTGGSRFYGFRFKGEKNLRARIPVATLGGVPEEKCPSEISKTEALDLLDDVNFLKQVFEKKYGSPSDVYDYGIGDICEKGGRVFWVQKSDYIVAAIGTIATQPAGSSKKKGSKKYCPVASIQSALTGINAEPADNVIAPTDSSKVKRERKRIEQGAESF